jgi:hypothetical protein
MNGESAAPAQTPAESVNTAEPSTESPSTVAETAGATDATAAQSTTQEPSLLGSLMAQMELPEGMAKPEVKEEPKEEEPQAAETPTEEETKTEEKTEETSETEEEEPVVAKEEWPEDARKRVADEARKRKKRTEERNRAYEVRDRLMQEVEQLKSQLQNASRPQPTRENPLADIEQPADLERIRKQSNDLKEFAELTMADWDNLEKEENDKGIETIEAIVGHKDGKPVTERFTKRQLADMKLKAERALTEQIPQRVDYLNKRVAANDATYRLYPDLKNESSELSVGVRQILQEFPEIRKSPEFMYWVANAVSRHLEIASAISSKKNGQTDSQAPAKKVVAAAKLPVAPAAVRSSISTGTGRVDSETARKRLSEGSEEEGDMEALIASKLQGGRSGVDLVQR